MHSKWLLILNPAAGGGKAGRMQAKIESHLNASGIAFTSTLTKKPREVNQIVEHSITQGYRNFIAAGGDGSLNELVNGIMKQTICSQQELSLAVIPVGTGNDWCKGQGIPNNIKESIHVINSGFKTKQDVMQIEFLSNSLPKTMYGINITGCGFDAEVVKRVDASRQKGNYSILSYLAQLINTLGAFECQTIAYQQDENFGEALHFAFLAGLSPFAGGSMKLIPHAPQRGNQLAITRVEKVSKWKVLRNILNLYSGKLAHIPEVNLSFATKISILSDGLNVQIDGELSGQTPIKIQLIPHCFYVMKPSES